MQRKAIAGLILAAEVSLAAYLTLVVWLLSRWMVDDSLAFRMAPADWYIEGARRFGGGLAVGALFYALAYFANRRWVTPVLGHSARLGTRTAAVLAACIVLAGAAGAIQFVITKPFM